MKKKILAAVLARNNPEVTAMDSLSSLSVGNGAGRYAIQRAGGRERNPVCLLPCYSHCRSPVPQSYDGQAFFE